jgi:hypothetical protein
VAGADPAGGPPRAAVEQGTGLGRRLTMYGLMGVYVLALKGVRAAIPSLVPPRLCPAWSAARVQIARGGYGNIRSYYAY